MALLSESNIKEIKEIFKDLEKEVYINLVKDDKNKETSETAEELLNEISLIDNRIKVRKYDRDRDEILRKFDLYLDKYGNRYGPIIFFESKPNIIFYGLPAGYEFSVFLQDIVSISKNSMDISLNAAKNISKIKDKIDIYVFVTPTCPYCFKATLYSHKFAFLNKNIRGIMIEATEFPEFSEKFEVYAVPKIVIIKEGEILDEWEGALSELEFSKRILEAIKE